VYGLRARNGAAIDLPIFGAAFRLVGTASAFDKLRALVAPIGAGRPLAGRPRTDPDAFLTTEYRDLAHIDGLVGADIPGGAASAFYDDLVAFARKQTADGGVVIPVVR
jgi:hypothetical protein